jgi:hypothetical protein
MSLARASYRDSTPADAEGGGSRGHFLGTGRQLAVNAGLIQRDLSNRNFVPGRH